METDLFCLNFSYSILNQLLAMYKSYYLLTWQRYLQNGASNPYLNGLFVGLKGTLHIKYIF